MKYSVYLLEEESFQSSSCMRSGDIVYIIKAAAIPVGDKFGSLLDPY